MRIRKLIEQTTHGSRRGVAAEVDLFFLERRRRCFSSFVLLELFFLLLPPLLPPLPKKVPFQLFIGLSSPFLGGYFFWLAEDEEVVGRILRGNSREKRGAARRVREGGKYDLFVGRGAIVVGTHEVRKEGGREGGKY